MKPRAIAMAVAAMLAVPAASAMEIDTGSPDLKLRWDNSFKYSAGVRVKDRNPVLIDAPNGANVDDGDRNFGKGLISNRLDWLTEADLTYRNFGARVSGAAWYDSVYNRSTDNNSPFTYNAISVPNTEFPGPTRDLHGRRGELLDAFVFAKGEIGDMSGVVRLGRHALVYGETLFFGANGIAAAQQPIDIVKAQSVPGTQFKELIRPVGQLSGQLQVNSNVSVGGYYQYRWEESLLPGVGSYFSSVDFLGTGAERLLLGPGAADVRTADLKARNSGQGGLQLKWTPEGSGFDFGFYAAQYHDKTPQVILRPATSTYALAYHENIRTYGVSATTTVGPVNFSAEASVRRNVALSNTATADLFRVVPAAFGGPAAAADNRDNPTYPVGRTAHLNLSALATLNPNFIAQESSLLAEVAWNRVTSVTRNAAFLDRNAERDSWGFRALYTPTYRQAMPGLDIDVPVSLSYFPKGRSGALGVGFGPDGGGDISIGINGNYQSTWNFGINYTHYYGPAAPGAVLAGLGTVYTYQQTLKDRDFISLTVRRTF
ncbi:hypothetical protein ASE07_12615 [Noviherbaspirillum sp. Root189]|nr:hypothetical protein ASE07_12615 [Noviherbaspirillum sp. Root189]